MTDVNSGNIIGSTKRQVTVTEIKPWPEISHTIPVRSRDPLWWWLLILLILTVLAIIIAQSGWGYLYDLYKDTIQDFYYTTASWFAVVLGALTLWTLLRVVYRMAWRVVQVRNAELHGMGDACVLKRVRKVYRIMEVPEQLREMEIYAVWGGFTRQRHLAQLWLPNCVEYLAHGLLRGCRGLRCVHLPEKLRAVPPYLMERCVRLQAVVIPPAAEEIGARAFAGCKSLRDVYITAGTLQIAADAFAGCSKLLLHVQEGSVAEQFARQNGIDFSYH